MDILLLTIPIALALAIVFIVMFILTVKYGQYDDLKTPAYKILLEEKNLTTKEPKDE